MDRKTLANVVFWFHIFWIIVLLSAVFLPSYLQPYHTFLALTTGIAQVLWGGCPLVTLENALRDEQYTGSFTAYVLRKLFGIEVKPWVVASSLVGIFLISAFLTLT